MKTDLENPINMDKLYGWWFTYNHNDDCWCAATGENRDLIYNDYNSPLVVKSKYFSTLQELIIRTDGNIDEMNKICK